MALLVAHPQPAPETGVDVQGTVSLTSFTKTSVVSMSKNGGMHCVVIMVLE